jgi:Holliday junction resolvase RusA-like endonuclease
MAVTIPTSKLTVELAPVPASRPRVTKWGAYYTGPYKRWMQEAEVAIPEAEVTHQGNLSVTLDLVCLRPRTTKRDNPRGDIDNYIKAVLDALTKKHYWNDDDQIVHLYAHKRWPLPDEEPHFRVRIEQT